MATPANVDYVYEIQDNRGFRALVRFSMFTPDMDTDATVVSDVATGVEAVGTTLAACTNAKIVKMGVVYGLNYAQQPSSETGVYQLVVEKARLEGGDGNGGFMSASIPAPKDALLLSSADNNLVVVDPAAGILTNLRNALAHSNTGLYPTARGGNVFAQFYGGQLVEAKPRRRRVLQGA